MLTSLAIAAALSTPAATSPRIGFEPSSPGRWSVAALELRHDVWLRARLLGAAGVTTDALGVESRYLHPLSLALSQAEPLVPGAVELHGRLNLTLSAWQTTYARDSEADAPPLLLCSSGSTAEATLGATFAGTVTLALVAGVQDDPVHFEDGADCLGGGPVWQSSRWIGASSEVRVAPGLQVSLAIGRSEHHVHDATRAHAHHGGAVHEHVSVRGASAVEGRAWLSADL